MLAIRTSTEPRVSIEDHIEQRAGRPAPKVRGGMGQVEPDIFWRWVRNSVGSEATTGAGWPPEREVRIEEQRGVVKGQDMRLRVTSTVKGFMGGGGFGWGGREGGR